ncbi:MAG: alkaline phosphatase PhoX [Pseudomonadota bacterium]
MSIHRLGFQRTATASAVSLALLFSSQAEAEDVAFTEVALPVEANEITVSSEVTLGEEAPQEIGFTELFRTGDVDPITGETYGLMKDYKGDPAVSGSGLPYICSGNTAGVAGSGTDFNALLEKHGKTYLISQFECQTGGMYMAEIMQTGSGELMPKPGSLQSIDQSKEWGGWVHCAGSVTPWNSYLGGEEYEPDAKKIELDETSDYYYNDKVRSYWLGDYARSSPYHNGWITEVDVQGNGQASFTKHYAMGRFSHELGYVMPDGKTAYLTDDGTNDTLFMFVADREGDLSQGTLYAAKWNQTSGFGGGSAQLGWINLGRAHNHQIKRAIKEGVVFSDMFDVDSENCTELSADEITECIELKPGMDRLASRLESRRYAALKGATYEFRKMEGFTFDAHRNQAYIAISEVGRGMLDNSYDPEKLLSGTERNYDDRDENGYVETGNHIRVAKADYCGAVYAMDMLPGVRDTSGKRIKSDLVAVNMNSILASGTAGGEISPNECAMNNEVMAQPDNITLIEHSNNLVIGEDGKHENNMVWSFDLDTHELTRIVTVPVGAETTSPYLHKVGDYSYMTLVAQHPDSSTDNPYGDSITGVVGPMTLVDNDDDEDEE